MASPRNELEVTIKSAKDLKNVNWRHGKLKPYVVVWVDPANRLTTTVEGEGDTCPYWDQTLVVPLTCPIKDSYLYVDIVHTGAAEGTKPLVGSARLLLREVVDEAGLGERANRKLELKRPSGRPQGKLEVQVVVRWACDMYYRASGPYYAPPPAAQIEYRSPYSVSQVTAQPGYGNSYSMPHVTAEPGYGNLYSAPPYRVQDGYTYGAPGAYGQQGYGQGGYGQGEYEQGSYGKEKKSNFGMGTGLAVGAVAGVLGGLAIAEGVDYVEDKIADDVVERVEDDLDDGGYYGDDF